MSNERIFFEEHISSLRNLTSLYQYINNNATLMEPKTLLRAEYVLIISAFDNYIHQIVRKKIREAFFQGLPMPSNLNLPVSIFQLIHSTDNQLEQQEILDAGLREVLEKDSYQSPKSVEYALSLISINRLWSTIAPCMDDTAEHIKNQLALIVKRRNQIAHEADLDYSTGFSRDINEQTILDCREFLLKFVSCIDSRIP